MKSERRARTSGRRGFTLLELMVVVGIIMLMTALAIPGIKKFMDGQRLQQSGRIIQSAFNEARRAAITQRERNYLVFFRQEDPDTGQVLHGVRRYRERQGYEGDAQYLLPNVEFEIDPNHTPVPAGAVGRLRVLGVPLFEGQPADNDATLFQGQRRPDTSDNGVGWVEFRKDGTINVENGAIRGRQKNAPTSGPAAGLFDLNVLLDVVPDSTANEVDLNIREGGDFDVNKRCFIDIDPNTGRVRFRVVRVDAGGGTVSR